MTQEVADTLRRAKALIDTPEKWCQGAKENARGQFCALGALQYIAASGAAIQTLENFVGARTIPVWNDAPGRTHAEVMAKFDAAIAAEEREP